MKDYQQKVNAKTAKLTAGGLDHSGKYSQVEPLQMDDEQADRIPPPRLNQMDPEDLARAEKDGLSHLFRPGSATIKRLEDLFKRAWDLFYDLIIDENGKPFIKAFFIWSQKTSEGDFAFPNDGICCGWGDHAGVGLGETALNSSDAYLQFLIIHELAHTVDTHGPEHSESYEQFLDYMLLAYNEEYGTALKNDYAGYSEYQSDIKEPASIFSEVGAGGTEGNMKQRSKSRIDGKTAGQRKKTAARKPSDYISENPARLRMIQRMQSEKQTAASENVQIRKDYSGIHR